MDRFSITETVKLCLVPLVTGYQSKSKRSDDSKIQSDLFSAHRSTRSTRFTHRQSVLVGRKI